MICKRKYALKSILAMFLLLSFASAGCTPYFTRHYEDSFFAVGRDKKFSVEIVSGKKDLGLENSAVGIIVHDGNDEDVERAEVAATAVIQENDRERTVACAVTEKGRGLYVAGALDLRQAGLSRLEVRIDKDGVSDVAVFDFPGKNQAGSKKK